MDYHFFHQRSFSAELQTEFADFVQKQQARFPANEILRMDLHCHDYNSDVPDEILGRIMKVPETWTPTETVIQTLKQNGCDAFTITNHNNARSCYAMQDKGFDLLTAAEFSCSVPDFNIGIHVLAYGFTPEQEVQLNKKKEKCVCLSGVRCGKRYTNRMGTPTLSLQPATHSRHGLFRQDVAYIQPV